MNETLKAAVLQKIAPGTRWQQEGKTTYRSPLGRVHARFKSTAPFSFNINPATLQADYELWICGSPDYYYLLPIAPIQRMYEHPDAYMDYRHPNIRVVSVDVNVHRAMYARGGECLSIHEFFRASISQPGP